MGGCLKNSRPKRGYIQVICYSSALKTVDITGFFKKFCITTRTKANRENVKRDNNNVLEFLESEGYIRFQPEASASSKELHESYRLWCEENSMTALKNRSFSDAMIAVQTKYNLVRMYIVIQCKLHIIYFSGWLSEVA